MSDRLLPRHPWEGREVSLDFFMDFATAVRLWRWCLPRADFDNWMLDYRALDAWENEGGECG